MDRSREWWFPDSELRHQLSARTWRLGGASSSGKNQRTHVEEPLVRYSLLLVHYSIQQDRNWFAMRHHHGAHERYCPSQTETVTDVDHEHDGRDCLVGFVGRRGLWNTPLYHRIQVIVYELVGVSYVLFVP